MFAAFTQSLALVLTPMGLLSILGGVLCGIFVGVMPGLSSVMGMSIMLPVALSLNGNLGVLMMLGIFCGAIYGGSITAIMINTPGTANSAATCLDGYPMAHKHHQPGRALSISTTASTFGGLFSAVMLLWTSPILSSFALKFSAQESFALALFGISVVASVSSENVLKGVMGALIGLLLATVGVDVTTGAYRFTFDTVYLTGGISNIPVLIGLFAFSQGLINVQYAFMANTLYVIEANPRASRTVPFASKATGVALAKAAARIMAGETIADQRANGLLLPKGDGGDIHPGQQVAVKESVLPFKRFRTPVGKTVDILLGPEMRSTGEVMGFDRDFPHAFAKSQLAAYDGGLPTHGNVFISVNDTDKRQLPLIAVRLEELGFKLWATEGTASVLRRYGIESNIVDKISTRVDTDPEAPVEVHHAAGSVGKNVVQLIEEGKIDMILNTPNSRGSRSDGYSIRAAAIAADLPQFTTITEFQAALLAIEAVKHNDYQIMSIQEHSKQLFELERREF